MAKSRHGFSVRGEFDDVLDFIFGFHHAAGITNHLIGKLFVQTQKIFIKISDHEHVEWCGNWS